MSDRSDELLFAWLNQRAERLTAFSARHRLFTDLVLALLAAAKQSAGLRWRRSSGTVSAAQNANSAGVVRCWAMSPMRLSAAASSARTRSVKSR